MFKELLQIHINTLTIIILVFGFYLLPGCKKKVKDCPCQCTDFNNNIIIDTTFHTTQDEAYQLCMGLESKPNVENCKSYE